MTAEQQAASDALGRAVLATERARIRYVADGYGPAFDAWRDAYRAETDDRAELAVLAGEEVAE